MRTPKKEIRFKCHSFIKKIISYLYDNLILEYINEKHKTIRMIDLVAFLTTHQYFM